MTQFRLLHAIASQSNFSHERFETLRTADFFFQQVGCVVLQIAKNDRLFPVLFQALRRISQFRRSIAKQIHRRSDLLGQFVVLTFNVLLLPLFSGDDGEHLHVLQFQRLARRW